MKNAVLPDWMRSCCHCVCSKSVTFTGGFFEENLLVFLLTNWPGCRERLVDHCMESW